MLQQTTIQTPIQTLIIIPNSLQVVVYLTSRTMQNIQERKIDQSMLCNWLKVIQMKCRMIESTQPQIVKLFTTIRFLNALVVSSMQQLELNKWHTLHRLGFVIVGNNFKISQSTTHCTMLKQNRIGNIFPMLKLMHKHLLGGLNLVQIIMYWI